MRNALTPIALLIAACSVAQTFERVEVVNVDSTRSAADLYRTAERWFVDTFKDAQEVIQLRDTVARTVVGKGVRKVLNLDHLFPPYWYHYTVEVSCKDGRYRCRIYDMNIQSADPAISFDPVQLRVDSCCFPDCTMPAIVDRKLAEDAIRSTYRMCSDLHAAREGLIASLKAAMAKPKDDW